VQIKGKKHKEYLTGTQRELNCQQ